MYLKILLNILIPPQKIKIPIINITLMCIFNQIDIKICIFQYQFNIVKW